MMNEDNTLIMGSKLAKVLEISRFYKLTDRNLVKEVLNSLPEDYTDDDIEIKVVEVKHKSVS